MWPRGVTRRPFTERPHISRAPRQGSHANSRTLRAAKPARDDTSQRRRCQLPPTSQPSSGTSQGESRDQPQESEWSFLPSPGQYRDWSYFPHSSETRPGLCGRPSTATTTLTKASTVAPTETPTQATPSAGTRTQDNHTVSDATAADTCILCIQSFNCKGFKQ